MASRTVVAALAGAVAGVVIGYFAFSPKNGSNTAQETVRVEPPIRNPPDRGTDRVGDPNPVGTNLPPGGRQ
jgi:hypothetical protein